MVRYLFHPELYQYAQSQFENWMRTSAGGILPGRQTSRGTAAKDLTSAMIMMQFSCEYPEQSWRDFADESRY